jgi:hypothetical protein
MQENTGGMPHSVAAAGATPILHTWKGKTMTAGHWIRIVTLTSALAVIGGALAQNTDRATRADDESGVATYGTEPPSAGAIVTPEDKALGMGKEDARAGDRDGHVDRDTSTSNDETPSTDDILPPERRPAPSRSLGTRDNTSRIDEGSSTGSEIHRGDMGHGDLRAE